MADCIGTGCKREGLQAAIATLRAENFALAAGQCANVTADDGGTPQCAEIARLRAERDALKGALEEADDLLGIAWSAHEKMRLRGAGSDCGLSHEVRMFALEFSPEGREGPGALQVQGTGRFMQWRRAARAALNGEPK